MDSFCLVRLAFTRLAPFIVFICESVGCGATAIRSLVHVRAASGESNGRADVRNGSEIVLSSKLTFRSTLYLTVSCRVVSYREGETKEAGGGRGGPTEPFALVGGRGLGERETILNYRDRDTCVHVRRRTTN